MLTESDRKTFEVDAIVGILKFSSDCRRKSFVGEKVKKSQLQQNVLKKVYEITNFPSTETRCELALLLGIPQRSVQVWFQNRRQITRKKGDRVDESDKDDECFDVPTCRLIDMIKGHWKR